MELIQGWFLTVWTDFSLLSPTAQVTFVLGGLTFVAGVLVGLYKLLRKPKSVSVTQLTSAEDERARILNLIEKGNVSVADATELARTLYGAWSEVEVARPGRLDGASADARVINEMSDSNDARLEFSKIVTELATSSDENDRDVIMKYARGDRTAAILTLVARAEKAGADGAQLWRQVAALAMPFDQGAAIHALRQAADLDPNDCVSLCRLSRAHSMRDDAEAAKSAAEEALSRARAPSDRARALNRLAIAYVILGQTGKASDAIEKAVDEARKGAAEMPDDIKRAQVLANAYESQSLIKVSMGQIVDGNAALDRAITLYDSILKLVPDNEFVIAERLFALVSQVYLDRATGNPEKAVQRCSLLLNEIVAASTAYPDNLWIAKEQGIALLHMAYAYDEMGRDIDAFHAAERAEAICNALIRRDPALQANKTNRLWAQVLKARVSARQGHIDTAKVTLDQMIASSRRAAQSGTVSTRNMLSIALQENGALRLALGDLLGAEESYTEAHELSVAIAAADPDDVDKQIAALTAAFAMASILSAKDDYVAQLDLLKNITARAEELMVAFPALKSLKTQVAVAYSHLGDAYSALMQTDAAIAHAKRAEELYMEIARINPESFEEKSNALICRRVTASHFLRTGEVKQARRLIQCILEELDALAETPEKESRLAPQRSTALFLLASTYEEDGDFDTANAARVQATELLKARYEVAPMVAERRLSLISAFLDHGKLLANADHYAEAMVQYELGEALIDQSSNQKNRVEAQLAMVLRYNRSFAARNLGEINLSRRLAVEALEMAEAQGHDPADLQGRINLGFVYLNEVSKEKHNGNWDAARDWLKKIQKIVDMLEQNPAAAKELQKSIINEQIDIALNIGDRATALDRLEQLISHARDDVDTSPTPAKQAALADLALRQAGLSYQFGRPNSTLPGALALLERLDRDHSSSPLVASQLSDLWERLAAVHNLHDDYAKAVSALERALIYLPETEDPGSLNRIALLRLDLAETHDFRDAVAAMLEEVGCIEALLPAMRAGIDERRYIVHVEEGLARLRARAAIKRTEFDAAYTHIAEAEALSREYARLTPSLAEPIYSWLECHGLRLDILEMQGRLEDGSEIIKALAELIDALKKVVNDNDSLLKACIYFERSRASVQAAQGQDFETLSLAQETLEKANELQARVPSAWLAFQIGLIHRVLSQAYAGLKDNDAALTARQASVEQFTKLTNLAPDNAVYARNLLRDLYAVARLSQEPTDYVSAARQLTRCRSNGVLLDGHAWAEQLFNDPHISAM